MRFHDLRYTAIARYALLSLSPIHISVVSGHKDIRMLQRYTHLQAWEVVEMMR